MQPAPKCQTEIIDQGLRAAAPILAHFGGFVKNFFKNKKNPTFVGSV